MWRSPNRRARPGAACLLLVGLGAGALAGQSAETLAEKPDGRLHLVVLHTNDVHGQVLPRPATWLRDAEPGTNSGGLPRLAACIERVREEARREGFELLVVDAGDWFQGTPEGGLDRGRGLLAALVEVGYDAMVVGNHEFDHGLDVLLGHLKRVKPPALLANATLEGGAPLPGTDPYRIVERGKLRIALVGLLATFTPQITHPSAGDLIWRAPDQVLGELRRELEGEVDWILPITHQGVEADRELARAHPDLDLIVGGHSHSLLWNGVTEGETLIVQAGSKASVVGRVDLWFDRETEQVVEKRCRLLDLYEDPVDAHRKRAVEKLSRELVARSQALMDVEVGELRGPLTRGRDPFATSPAGNLITDVMRERAGADVAIQNRGGIRADLPAGPVTRRQLFQVLPFDNHLVTVTLTGAELLALLRKGVEGEGHSGLEFSGMLIELARGAGRPRLVRILVGEREQPLEPGRRYTVATNSFTAGGGDGYGVLAAGREREVDPILLRDLLERAFEDGPLTPPGANRYRSAR